MELLLDLREDSSLPLYLKIAQAMKEQIATGKLPAGKKLPSTRELAETMGISRDTAARAYDELSRLGFIVSRSASGTYVSSSPPNASGKAKERSSLPDTQDAGSLTEDLPLSQYGVRIMTSPAIESFDIELYPELNYSAAALDQLPLAKWRELLSRSSRLEDLSARSYQSDPFGHERLREAIAGYLARSRAVKCTMEQIVLFAGAQPALDLIARVLLDRGDAAAVENPGFPGARRTFAANGARLCPVPVDEQGLMTERLSGLPEKTKVIYVTPSHHDPTGVALTLPRRRNLLEWAASHDTVVVEDDFDSEYRYGEKPMPVLQEMDRGQSVIFLSSFWKVMFPVLRLGFIVLPPRFVPVIKRAKSLVERDFHFVEHEALARFIEEGHLERHIRKTRSTYARRREALVIALNQALGAKAKISPTQAGMHLLVKIDSVDQNEVLRCAQMASLSVVPTSGYYLVDHAVNEYLIPFAQVDEEKLGQAVRAFAELLGG